MRCATWRLKAQFLGGGVQPELQCLGGDRATSVDHLTPSGRRLRQLRTMAQSDWTGRWNINMVCADGTVEHQI